MLPRDLCAPAALRNNHRSIRKDAGVACLALHHASLANLVSLFLFFFFLQRYQETDTRDKKRNEELTEEFRRITKQYNDMQAKFRHFEISDNNRYEQVKAGQSLFVTKWWVCRTFTMRLTIRSLSATVRNTHRLPETILSSMGPLGVATPFQSWRSIVSMLAPARGGPQTLRHARGHSMLFVRRLHP